MNALGRFRIFCLIFICLVAVWGTGAGNDKESFSSVDRARAQTMLKSTLGDIKNNYYDRSFHGVDMDAQFREASLEIEHAGSFREAVQAIERAVSSLKDSHTHFLPPTQPYHIEYGYRMEMVGDTCYITRVKAGSDAAARNVMPGDIVQSIDGQEPSRDAFFDLLYSLNTFAPRSATTLRLLAPDKIEKEARVNTAVRMVSNEKNLTGMGAGITNVNTLVRERSDYQHYLRARYADLGDKLLVLKFPEFRYTDMEVDEQIARARKHQALIVDLRGNPGGNSDTLEWLLGGVFDYDVKIADRQERSGQKPLTLKSKGQGAFQGKLIVLVDQGSCSASEIFARVVQLEKRGTVIGDRTAGKVMEAKVIIDEIGASSSATHYGTLVTVANLIMVDGKSLEGSGVTPDMVVLPGAGDLVSGDDPVLALAARQFGVQLTPAEAGKLFPFEWPPQ
jgi:C-terminal processing protease CtpA/Prc